MDHISIISVRVGTLRHGKRHRIGQTHILDTVSVADNRPWLGYLAVHGRHAGL